ncbi:MAG: ABC transporter permease subunit [Actinomycetota bacterium]
MKLPSPQFLAHLENPVMSRELRSRMRGARSYLVTTGYVTVVALFVLVVYSRLGMIDNPQAVNQQAAQLGRAIWTWGCIAQALLVPFLVPAFTCGAITLERERDMLELLLLTRQSPLQICLGKLGSGTGLGLTLILATVPVLSLSFMLGGVSPKEVVTCIAVLMATVLAAGALGLAASSLAGRTSAASAVSYATVGFVIIGIPLLLTLTDRARMLNTDGAMLGLVLMLAAYMALTFVPGLGIAALLLRWRRDRTNRDADRKTWLLVGGLCWCAVLATLYLPGADEILASGWTVMPLHPVLVILSIMGDDSGATAVPGAGIFPVESTWWISVLGSMIIAAWCFQIAVLRVRGFRAG